MPEYKGMTVKRNGDVYEALRENREATVRTAIGAAKLRRSAQQRVSGLGHHNGRDGCRRTARSRAAPDSDQPLRAVGRALPSVCCPAASMMRIRTPAGATFAL